MESARKVVLYIAASLDGYIAEEDGGVAFLDASDAEADQNYRRFMRTIDTIIMGNKTYEQTKELASDFPYQEQACYVFSRSRAGEREKYVTFVNPDIPAFVAELRAQAGKNVWLMGGAEILDAFLKADAVDELIITVIPILLGKGISLFKSGRPELPLKLVKTEQLGEMVQLHYMRK